MNEILNIQALHAGYINDEGTVTPILHDINLTVQPGEIIGVVGGSGSGKSTLLHSITMLKGTPIQILEGTIQYNGLNLREINETERRTLMGSGIARVFQQAYMSLYPLRTIQAQCKELLDAHHVPVDKGVEDFCQMLAHMGFQEPRRILAAHPHELSGGMAQRVAIALALVLKPKLLLADEPTAALDATVQKKVLQELLELCQAYGTALLLVTHNINMAAMFTHRMYVMHDGRIVESGTTSDVMEHPQHEYTQALLGAVPILNGPLPKSNLKFSIETKEQAQIHQAHGHHHHDAQGRHTHDGMGFHSHDDRNLHTHDVEDLHTHDGRDTEVHHE